MENAKAPEKIEPWRVICASQSTPNYNEERHILLYDDDFPMLGGPFLVLEGWHCSCYDWDDVEWDATRYTRDELLALAESKETGGCYHAEERKFWELVRLALEVRDDAF